jgi:serine acetyltransferase
MYHVTLGGKDPWCKEANLSGLYPIPEQGGYVGAGAKILCLVTIGKWSNVGANAVVAKCVPPYSIVVGFNLIVHTSALPPQ